MAPGYAGINGGHAPAYFGLCFRLHCASCSRLRLQGVSSRNAHTHTLSLSHTHTHAVCVCVCVCVYVHVRSHARTHTCCMCVRVCVYMRVHTHSLSLSHTHAHKVCRTTSIETGIQSSALAVVLATRHFPGTNIQKICVYVWCSHNVYVFIWCSQQGTFPVQLFNSINVCVCVCMYT
jgi:hypothetical protein